MSPLLNLYIHNIGFSVSAVACIGVSLFLFLNNKRSTANVTFALTFLAAGVFIVSHVIGVNVSDPALSERILMFNVAMFFIGMFNVHAVIAFLNKDHERRGILTLIYAVGLFLVLWFIIHPDQFLLLSVSKMYFPNYYNPGILNWTRMAFLFGICVTYMIVELVIAYRQSDNERRRKQIKYFIFALVGGYGAGVMPNFLVYNVPVNPLWGMAFPVIAAIPIIYASLKYEFMNIRIIAKQAFLYTLSIVVVGGIIILFNYSNRLIEAIYPAFPFWITPLASAILVVLIAGFIWRKLREGELLKYEFITTTTHKFLTPLTSIKWAAESLKKVQTPENNKALLESIESANGKLVELINLLVNVSETESSEYEYHLERIDISAMSHETLNALSNQFAIKRQQLIDNIEPKLSVSGDVSRIRFIIQTLIENAIHYTPEGGTITVSVRREGQNVIYSVKDSGIGISKEEMPYLFSKFYRGSRARLADTEGMGIGLYIAKEIAIRHKGRIWAESEGVDKGSTFSLSLPAAE